MKPERAALLDVIESVADGESLDWDALEANITDEADRRMLAQLKILARIAEVHRSQPDDPSDRVIPTRSAKVIPIPVKPVLTVDEPAPRLVVPAAPVPPASIEPIGTWGPLELLERIGEGTFGEVFRARDALQREVAVKLLRADRGTADRLGEKVLREARILARIRHSNVVLVHNAETHDGRVGFWMELIRGTTLEHLLRAHGTFSAREAAFIGQDLCRALAAVHAAGLVHRDIKAQNVMREEGGRVVLMDFGAGQVVGDSAAAGRITGTPLYLAPEVLDGRDATVRSDIYSLGVLLYHLVTNDYPIRARTLDDLRLAHSENRRIRLHDARPDSLPDSLVRVIERATDPTPEKRYATAGEMQSDLVQAGGIGLPLMAPAAVPALTPGDTADAVAPTSVGSRIRALATRPAVLATAAVLALAVAALLVRAVWNGTGRDPLIPPRTVAVLPLERGDGIEEYQAADITDGIQQILSMGANISVISRRSTSVAVKSNLSSQEISERLKTDELIEGRIVRDGQTLHLTLRVIAAGTDASFWSAEFLAPSSDPRGLQREAGLAVAKRLHVALPPDRLASFKSLSGEQAAEAQDRYARARAFFNSGTDDGFARAADLFGEAVKIEPNYAQAYAGLARASIAAAVNPQLASRGHFDEAHEAASRALALDQNLAEAHAVIGQLAFMSWRWQEAEQSFKRAVELDPSNEYASEKYAFFLAARGRPAEGVTQMVKMRAVDPLSPAAAYSTATALQYSGRYNEALLEAQRALQLDPTNPVAHMVYGRVLAAVGRFDEAKREFGLSSGLTSGPDNVREEIASADADVGRRAEALAVAQAFEREFAESPNREQPELLGYLYARLGDADKAFVWLTRAFETQPDRMLWLKVDPRVQSLRGDPRFAALLARLDLQP